MALKQESRSAAKPGYVAFMRRQKAWRLPGAGGSGILYLSGQPHPALDNLLDIVFRPLQVGSKNKAMRFLINAPRNTDANSFQRPFGIAVPDSLHAVNHAGNRLGRIRTQGERRSGQQPIGYQDRLHRQPEHNGVR